MSLALNYNDYLTPKKGDVIMFDRIALVFLIIGGLNWGSIGLFRFDIVAWLCGGQTAIISRIVYTLVGLCALWCVSLLFREHNAVLSSEDYD